MTDVLYDGELGGLDVSAATPDRLRKALRQMAARVPSAFTIDPDASSGLSLVVRGGVELVGGAWVTVPSVTLTLPPNATSYVERAPGAAAVLGSSTWDPAKQPVCVVVTAADTIEKVEDCRPATPTSGAVVQRATLTLTAAEVLALTFTGGTWPILVPAPGAGKWIRPLGGWAKIEGQTVAYGVGDACAFYGDTPPDDGGELDAGLCVKAADVLAQIADTDEPDATTLANPEADGLFFSSGVPLPVLPAVLENKPLRLVAQDHIAAGIPTAYTVGAAGTGYAPTDEITLADNAVLTVATVGGGGEVLTFTLTTPGDVVALVGATVAEASTDGGGSGFEAEVATVTPGNGTLTIVREYVIEAI